MTQTAPAPTARAEAPCPTSIVRATPSALTRHTTPDALSTAHTAPSPTASPVSQPAGIRTREIGRPVRGSSRRSAPRSPPNIHTCPSPVASILAWSERCVVTRPPRRSMRWSQPERVMTHAAPLPAATRSPGETRMPAFVGCGSPVVPRVTPETVSRRLTMLGVM